MVIQIDKIYKQNKGSELMFIAILEEIKRKHPDAKIVWGRSGKIEFEDRAQLGLWQRFNFRKFGIPFYKIGNLFNIDISNYGLIYPNEKIDLVLDAGGFQFGDQWNHTFRDILSVDNYYRNLKKIGAKIVFLPQAFGPFEKKYSKQVINKVIKYSDLLIAREEASHQYLSEVSNHSNKIYCFPDFTNLVEGTVDNIIYNEVNKKVCVIPNRKMFTHTSHQESDNYFQFLADLVSQLKQSGKGVFLLNHEDKGDLQICRQLNEETKLNLPIYSGLSAKNLKGIIKVSSLVISGRFHGIASALSQGVPCLATSWSHKYPYLFKDYGILDGVLDIN